MATGGEAKAGEPTLNNKSRLPQTPPSRPGFGVDGQLTMHATHGCGEVSE